MSRSTRSRRPLPLLAGGLLAAALLAGACSDDEDASTTTAGDHHESSTSAPDGTPAGAPLEGEPVPAEACGHFSTLSAAMTGDPSIAGPALEMLVPSLPAELSEDGTTVVDSLRAAFDGDQTVFGDPEFLAAFEQLGTAMWAGCDAASRLDVTGVDYGFEGLPEQIPAGLLALRFTNGTGNEEPHELIVLQRPPGDETPIEEIAEMSPDEVMTDFPMTGVVFADSAEQSSATFMELPTGRYVAICTIPVGGGESGDPHAAHGMVAEFEAV
jgi:hypothetical protein